MAQLVVDRQKLFDFLEEHGKNQELMAETRVLLEPFFQAAEQGQYPLARGSAELAEEAKTALFTVLGRQAVKKVVLVSCSRPFPKPDWMSQKVYEVSLGDSLGNSLWDSLFYYLGFVIAGKAEQVKELTPLIRLLPRAIPLGQKRDEPGVWFVLVA